MKILIAYFSTEMGRTRALAKRIADIVNADLYEITPKIPYSKADLNYLNPISRCNKEKLGKKKVPVSGRPKNFEQYDMVLIGFPVWYGCAPNVVNTFCEGLDFEGKKVAAFATSGGSGIGKSASKLDPYVKGADVLDAKLFNNASADDIKVWVESL